MKILGLAVLLAVSTLFLLGWPIEHFFKLNAIQTFLIGFVFGMCFGPILVVVYAIILDEWIQKWRERKWVKSQRA